MIYSVDNYPPVYVLTCIFLDHCIIVSIVLTQNTNLPLPISLLFPPNDLLILWVPLFHDSHPMQVHFYLQWQQPHLQNYPSPTSTSSSSCSFHSNHPEFCSQYLACNPFALSVAYQGWHINLLSQIIWWRFHQWLVSLRERTLTVYAYQSCCYGHWWTANPTSTLSYSSLPDLYDPVSRTACMTIDDQTLALSSLSFPCQEGQCTCTETFKTTDHAIMWIHNA